MWLYVRVVVFQGALVNQYGPGTVFHHFKQQRRRRRNETPDLGTLGTHTKP